jgi:hypothetical protein
VTTPTQFRSLQQPITAITPLRRGMSWLAWLLLVVLRRISKLTMARDLDFIHFAGWQRVRTKRLPRLSPDQPAEDFTNDFFVFTTNYNGDWDQYIDTFARVPRIRRGMQVLWGTSQGFPGPIPLRNFKEYIHYLSYPENLYYSAYPGSTVRNIEAALKVKAQLRAFVAASSPTETPAAFKQRYLGMVKSIAPYLGSAPARSPYVIAAPERPVLGPLAGGGGGRQQVVTALSPIEVKPASAVTREIARVIADVAASSAPSPFAKCPMLHFARLVVIDDLRPRLGSSPTTSLRTNYLLFAAAIDGELDDFLDCLYAADPDFSDRVWGRCLGYPEDRGGPIYLRRYIARSLLPVQLPFVGFPGQTALDIRGAVSIHADLLEWMAHVRSSQMEDAALMTAWQGWLEHLFAGTEASR